MRPPVAVTALVCAVLLAGCTTTDDSATGAKGYVTGDGTVTVVDADDRPDAPAISGDLLGGGTLDLGVYDGQTIVLNIWGSWCGPCRGEAPDLVKASKHLTQTQFVGLNTKDNDSLAEAFVRRYEIPYPSLRDQDSKLALKFAGMVNLVSLPATIVIDEQGRVAATVSGAISATSLVDLVEQVEAS